MASSSVRDSFDRLASEYDALKLRVIPGYREVQALVERYATVPDPTPARVLELGLGTGEWAERFLQLCPSAELEGVELSEGMREIAARRLKPFEDRVRLHDTDMNAGLPSGRFDLVVSFFALHHVVNKSRLIQEVFGKLVEGGRFLYADITSASSPALERLYVDGWVAFMRKAGLEEKRISAVLQDHRENDLPETAERQVAYLHEAGFGPATVVWSYEKFSLFFGAK